MGCPKSGRLTPDFVTLYIRGMGIESTGQPSPPEGSRASKDGHIPSPAVRRLCLYLRELEGFLQQDRQTVSSKQLGLALGLTDAQVRKDLAYFGQFGYPGVGYRVDELIARIRSILGTDRTWHALLVGAGNLGRALLSYRGFFKKGFQIVAAFDHDPQKIGARVGNPPGLVVSPVEQVGEVIARHDIQIAILCVPVEAAQVLADRLVACGIKGILNFAPASLNLPEDVALISVDLALHFEQLAFWISARQVAREHGG